MEEHLRPKELVGSSSLFRGTQNTSPLWGACVALGRFTVLNRSREPSVGKLRVECNLIVLQSRRFARLSPEP